MNELSNYIIRKYRYFINESLKTGSAEKLKQAISYRNEMQGIIESIEYIKEEIENIINLYDEELPFPDVENKEKAAIIRSLVDLTDRMKKEKDKIHKELNDIYYE